MALSVAIAVNPRASRRSRTRLEDSSRAASQRRAHEYAALAASAGSSGTGGPDLRTVRWPRVNCG